MKDEKNFRNGMFSVKELIEGNTSDKCAERMYSFDNAQVMGYGSPKYEQ